MKDKLPPYDLQAEEALIGAMILNNEAIGEVMPLCSAEDLYTPRLRVLFATMADMHSRGEPVDATTLSGALTLSEGDGAFIGPAGIMSLVANAGFVSNVAAYATRVVKCAAYRKLIVACKEIGERAFGQDGDPSELGDMLNAAVLDIHKSDVVEVPGDVWTIDGFLDRPVSERPKWVIPGLMRVGWRVMVVAQEGIGKTVLLRQLGIAAAQGIHPLRFTPIPPCRTLIVDLENPDDSIIDVCNPIRAQVGSVAEEYDPDRAWLWHRPGGVNLRSRRDRSELESVIAHVRPTLVCLGPIYKAYRVEARESDEQASSEVMSVFDDLRTRYCFGLILEHHAPKGSGGTRDLMPYGSSLWLRWPEIGLKLESKLEGNGVMDVGRWRGDRLENDWPDVIERSTPWPWKGVWQLESSWQPQKEHWDEVPY